MTNELKQKRKRAKKGILQDGQDEEMLHKNKHKFEILDLDGYRKYGFIFKPDEGKELQIIQKFTTKAQDMKRLELDEKVNSGEISQLEAYKQGLALIAESLVEPSIEEYDRWSNCLFEDEQVLLALVVEKAKEEVRKKW